MYPHTATDPYCDNRHPGHWVVYPRPYSCSRLSSEPQSGSWCCLQEWGGHDRRETSLDGSRHHGSAERAVDDLAMHCADLGEAGAIAAMRGLAQAVHDTTRTFVSAVGRSSGPNAHDAYGRAFQLAQAAAFSDTAAVLQITLATHRAEALGLSQLSKQVHQLRAEIDIAEALAGEFGTLTPFGAFRRKAQLQRELSQLRSAAETSHPTAARTLDDLFSDVSILPSATDAAAKLAKNEKLLLSTTGADGSVIFLVNAQGAIRAHRNRFGHASLSDAVSSIRAGIVPKNGIFPNVPVAGAHEFFRDFFGPLGSELARSQAVVFVVSGPLEALPLAVLPTRDDRIANLVADQARSHKISWLVRSTRISRSPSVHAFISLRQISDSPSQIDTFLGVGDPVLAPTQVASRRGRDFPGIVTGKRLADVDWLRRLSSLPETRDELTRLAQVFGVPGSKLLLGAAANEAAIKSMDLSRFEVIAFATHGIIAGAVFDDSQPGIVLTPPERATIADDGFLSMGEVAALRLNAGLVILSACDTARRGEMFSTRGILYALLALAPDAPHRHCADQTP